MPLTENEIRNLLSLDDKRFGQVISEICIAVGADPAKAKSFSQNPAGVKSLLSTMSADEINKLLDKAGRQKSNQVLDKLRGNG